MAYGSELNSLIEVILESLFGNEDRRLDRLVEILNRENDKKLGHPATGFLVMGRYFKPKEAPASRDREMLHLDLLDQGLAFLADMDRVSADRQRVKQTLYLMLRFCRTEQDIRDALPDCLQTMVGQTIRNLPRTRPEGYTIIDNERAYRQFLEIKETIEFYSVSGLLY